MLFQVIRPPQKSSSQAVRKESVRLIMYWTGSQRPLHLMHYHSREVIFSTFNLEQDRYEGRTRYSRRSSATDTELMNKLDSIVSLLGKLNDKIDSQEQRIAVLSRQVSNINCNGKQGQGYLK
ncbi:hypothetical protein OS493_040124 [Desmophyllum pertusum]|uniref:Uncharacterized protein n=1 Tax=Desmophyllum pertusum TaxID=174260 RepID=A0A9W9ZUF3_9CNID|nr:hypothetical protein OS493_040124 [Desmophyllum pertusum]